MILVYLGIIMLKKQNMNNRKSNVLKKICEDIRMVITDVDGILTDGGMYYSEKGELLKKFNARDGMGFELLRKNQINTIILTREKSQIVVSRAKKIKADECFIGVLKKENKLKEICKKYDISPNNIAYIGDDVNDKEIMKLVGFPATCKDGISEIKKISKYIAELKGGEGVFREIADLILRYKSQ